MEGDSPTVRTPLIVRGQALFFSAVAVAYLFTVHDRDSVWFNVGIAVFGIAIASLLWNIGRIGSAPSVSWPRRLVVVAYLAALALFLVSILANQQIVPSVVFGTASLGMALLIGKLPSLVSGGPAA